MEGSVSQAEFARLANVSRQRVGQWIREGKIHGGGLDAGGRIVVDVAKQQLKRSLDIGQRVGNGLMTRLDPPVSRDEPAPPPAEAGDTELPFKPSGDLIADQIQLEKLKEIRARNRRQDEEELQRRGSLTPTVAVQDGYRKVAGRVLNVMDGGLATMASHIASQFQIPQRDVLHLMRLDWREIRRAGEAELRREVTVMPAVVEVDSVEPGIV